MNYYLNEIEALAQSGIFEKSKGKKKSSKGNKNKVLKKEQDKLRVKVLKYFLNLYAVSANWKSFLGAEEIVNAKGNSEIRKEIKSNDEINIKKFQQGLYERIINTIFKSIKFLATDKSSNQDTSAKNLVGNGHKASHDSNTSGNQEFEKEKLLKWSLNKYQKVVESMLSCPELAENKPRIENLIRLLTEVNGIGKNDGGELDPKLQMLLNLVQGLLLVNVFDDSFDDSFEAAQDLIMIIQKLKFTGDDAKPKKKKKVQETDAKDSMNPYEVLTDALISLCSTSISSLRSWLGEIFGLFVPEMPANCCQLIIDALIKTDNEYVKQMIISENKDMLIEDEDDYDEEQDIEIGRDDSSDKDGDAMDEEDGN